MFSKITIVFKEFFSLSKPIDSTTIIDKYFNNVLNNYHWLFSMFFRLVVLFGIWFYIYIPYVDIILFTKSALYGSYLFFKYSDIVFDFIYCLIALVSHFSLIFWFFPLFFIFFFLVFYFVNDLLKVVGLNTYTRNLNEFRLSFLFFLFYVIVFIILLFTNSLNNEMQRYIGYTCFVLLKSKVNCYLNLLFNFNNETNSIVLPIEFFNVDFLHLNILNGSFYFDGLDSLSLLFVGLTILLIGLCFCLVKVNYVSEPLIRGYILMMWFLMFCLNSVFLTQNLLVFFIAFECVLLPMVFLIGIWGSPSRRQANNYLIFYTSLGAIPMMLVVLYLWGVVGSSYNLTVGILSNISFTIFEERFLWLGLFLSFAIKTPMVPVHIWLPKAHVDASTTGSVILAGLLLKIGLFGIVKFLMPIFPYATSFFAPYILIFATIGVLYSSMVTLWQIDIKRIIAYSSIAHMNMALASMFSLSGIGVLSAVFIMLSHGIISSALFFLVGFLYNRFHQRGVIYYGGLNKIMPVFTSFFFFFLLSNMAFPLTMGFVSEFLCLSGIMLSNNFLGVLNTCSMFFTTAYSVLLFNKVCFGSLSSNFEYLLFQESQKILVLAEKNKNLLNTSQVVPFFDLNNFELFIVTVLCFFTILGGVFPQILFYLLQNSVFLA